MTLLPSRMVWSRLVNCLPRAEREAVFRDEDGLEFLAMLGEPCRKTERLAVAPPPAPESDL